jgi:hypothetical protein
VGFSIVNKVKAFVPSAALASVVTGAFLVSLSQPARAISPAYTSSGASAGYCEDIPAQSYVCGLAQSYGFFFETDRDLTIDALGFSSQPGWPNGNSQYEVQLWSYINGGGTFSDYTLIESRTFIPGESYTFDNGFFWQDIPLVKLLNSTSGDPGNLKGFVIGVVGDFTNQGGNVGYESATATFRPGIVSTDSGYNGGPSATDPFWSVPVYPGGFGTTGFFNGNLSFAPVPSPLPMLGSAAGFSWTRRMRQRIRLSR